MIREFLVSDQAQATQLQEDFMTEFFPEFADDPRKYEWNADAYAIDEHYLQRGGKAWVVEIEGAIAGFACLRPLNATTAEIKRVRIGNRHRGKGLGKSIMRQIESYCVASRLSKIRVDTDARFEAANAMYNAMGYIRYRSLSETKDGREYTDHYYEKTL